MDINKALDSAIHLKVIEFFHENQSAIDTPRGVATWISEDRETVKKVLEDLVNMDILIAHRSSSITGYSYTREAKLLSRIKKLLAKKKRS